MMPSEVNFKLRELTAQFEHDMKATFTPGTKVDYYGIFKLIFQHLASAIA